VVTNQWVGYDGRVMVKLGNRQPSKPESARNEAGKESSVAERTLRALTMEIGQKRDDLSFQTRLQASIGRNQEILERLVA
jgi:phosphoserine phosphatase